MNRLIGAHMPTSKGFGQAIRDGKEIGCGCVQVFTTSPMQWRGKNITDEMVGDFQTAIKETKIGAVASHAIYLINLASPDDAILTRSREAYAEELRRCKRLGIPYAVVHVGKHMESGEEAGVKKLGESMRFIIGETDGEADIAMETDAGQGTCVGHRFEQLAQVIEANNGHERLKICLDTCHVFVAGYDIRSAESFRKVINEFDKVIGLDRLVCIHANDAKKGLGTRVDRHTHIGDGEIGVEAFRYLVNEKKLAKVPIYIETPEMDKMHAENVRRLQDLVK